MREREFEREPIEREREWEYVRVRGGVGE